MYINVLDFVHVQDTTLVCDKLHQLHFSLVSFGGLIAEIPTSGETEGIFARVGWILVLDVTMS